MDYTQHTQQWGNATGIRLPKKVLQAVRWHPGQTVSIKAHGDSITLTPLTATKRQLPDLRKLLRAATPDQFTQGELDWGPDVGAEIIDDDYSR